MERKIELLGKYINGNYTVRIYSDGTKIRETKEDELIPSFAENCDVKITDRCDGGCAFCYEGCTPQGKHGNIMNQRFLDTLHPYTELAINGNDLSHPDLVPFLKLLKAKKIIVNMTVNQIHFDRNIELISDLIDRSLIYGLGISLHKATDEFFDKVKIYPKAVIHVINGVVSRADMEKMYDKNLKLLILGYKHMRRGSDWYENNKDTIITNQLWLKDNMKTIMSKIQVVSFDNLALEQLGVRGMVSETEWNQCYMGDDGSFTFYIDLVEEAFGRNSLATEKFPLMDTIDDMFRKIMKEKKMR